MEKNKSRNITAAEARKIADSTNSLKNRLYKLINEAAKDGITYLFYECAEYSKALLEDAISDLKKEGFKVDIIRNTLDESNSLSEEHDYATLKIHW